jgi:hypothetical protein
MQHMSDDRYIFISFLAIAALMTGACGVEQGAPPEDAVAAAEDPGCSLESLRELPDVRINAVTEEAAPVPHCKVAGGIGTETNFELLLRKTWKGKFMTGSGGIVKGVSAQVLTYAAADFPLAQIHGAAPSSMLD